MACIKRILELKGDLEYCVKYGLEPRDSFFSGGTVKDYSYMERECKSLIDQLISKELENA